MSHNTAELLNFSSNNSPTQNYQDIINLGRPTSKHPKMPVANRAAQFMPFAAVENHKNIVRSTEDESIYPDTHYTDPEGSL